MYCPECGSNKLYQPNDQEPYNYKCGYCLLTFVIEFLGIDDESAIVRY